MGIFNKKKDQAWNEYVKSKKAEAEILVKDFEKFVKKYPLLYKSQTYNCIFYSLKYDVDFPWYYSSEQIEKTIKDMDEKIGNFKQKCHIYENEIAKNIEAMKEFAKEHKKFFVLESLLDDDKEIKYCFSYNLQYHEDENAFHCLMLTNQYERPELAQIKASEYKIREMKKLDFGKFADARINFKLLNDTLEISHEYEKLSNYFLAEELKK